MVTTVDGADHHIPIRIRALKDISVVELSNGTEVGIVDGRHSDFWGYTPPVFHHPLTVEHERVCARQMNPVEVGLRGFLSTVYAYSNRSGGLYYAF